MKQLEMWKHLCLRILRHDSIEKDAKDTAHCFVLFLMEDGKRSIGNWDIEAGVQ